MNDSRIEPNANDATDRCADPSWRRQLAEAIRDPDELCDLLNLPNAFREAARRAATLFPLVVPRGFVALMQSGDVNDPLLMQVLPVEAEWGSARGFVADPLEEAAATIVPGMLKKYRGRALLIVAGDCAINCRYCFRRTFPYDQSPATLEAWQPAINAIAADADIEEVILSGGDPLARTDAWLARLVAQLHAIPHLRRMRVHTRMPVVLPSRVTPELLDLLQPTIDGVRSVRAVVVIHANHPRELSQDCRGALRALVRGGITVLNQSVLLRGINDSAAVLAELSRDLFACGVLPYYLHQLDRVAGASQFETASAHGLRIMDQLRSELPGYLVPQFVAELPGELSKVPVQTLELMRSSGLLPKHHVANDCHQTS